MDINTVDEIIAKDEELAVLPEILDKDGNPYLAPDGVTPCTISVYGPESKAARKAKRTEWRKMVKRTGTPDLEDVEDNRLEKAAACVGDWSGWTSGQEPAACTPTNVKALLKAEHILAQVEAGIARHAAFLSARKAS